MAKTEVILTHNIVGLGAEADKVKVAAGYARNYLFPKGYAIPASAGNKKHIEALQKRRAEREAQELNTMTELAKSLSKLVCVIQVKTGDDGKMFGTVTNGTIADHLKTQFDIALDKKKIVLPKPIHALGEYEVEMHLHPNVKGTLKVRVESSNPLPQPQPQAEEPKGETEAPKEARTKEGRPQRRPTRKSEAKADSGKEAKG